MRDPLKFTEPNRLVLQCRVPGSTTDAPQWTDYSSIKTSEDLFIAKQKCRGDYLGFRIQDSEDGWKTVYPPYPVYLKALINYKLGSIIAQSNDPDQEVKLVYDLVCAIEKPSQTTYTGSNELDVLTTKEAIFDPGDEHDQPAIYPSEMGIGNILRAVGQVCMESEGAGNGYMVGACLAVLAEVDW